jgi:hypothetical protein
VDAGLLSHYVHLCDIFCRICARIYADIWNSLPEEIIVAKTVKEFEIGLDNHWKHQECKYDFSMDKYSIKNRMSRKVTHIFSYIMARTS